MRNTVERLRRYRWPVAIGLTVITLGGAGTRAYLESQGVQKQLLQSPTPTETESLPTEVLSTPESTPTEAAAQELSCVKINAPGSPGYDNSLQDILNGYQAVLAAGEEGIDDPPYVVLHPDGTFEIYADWHGLNPIYNGDSACVFQAAP